MPLLEYTRQPPLPAMRVLPTAWSFPTSHGFVSASPKPTCKWAGTLPLWSMNTLHVVWQCHLPCLGPVSRTHVGQRRGLHLASSYGSISWTLQAPFQGLHSLERQLTGEKVWVYVSSVAPDSPLGMIHKHVSVLLNDSGNVMCRVSIACLSTLAHEAKAPSSLVAYHLGWLGPPTSLLRQSGSYRSRCTTTANLQLVRVSVVGQCYVTTGCLTPPQGST